MPTFGEPNPVIKAVWDGTEYSSVAESTSGIVGVTLFSADNQNVTPQFVDVTAVVRDPLNKGKSTLIVSAQENGGDFNLTTASSSHLEFDDLRKLPEMPSFKVEVDKLATEAIQAYRQSK